MQPRLGRPLQCHCLEEGTTTQAQNCRIEVVGQNQRWGSRWMLSSCEGRSTRLEADPVVVPGFKAPPHAPAISGSTMLPTILEDEQVIGIARSASASLGPADAMLRAQLV